MTVDLSEVACMITLKNQWFSKRKSVLPEMTCLYKAPLKISPRI